MNIPIVPREVLFGNPTNTAPRLSPDGTRLSFLAPLDGVLNVWVRPLEGGEAKPVTRDTDRGIRSYFWAPNARQILYVQDKGGDENWRLYAVDAATFETRDLTPFENVQARIVDVDKRRPNEILVALNRRRAESHDVYRLQLADGRLDLIVENPGSHAGWIADHQQRVLVATAMNPEGGADLLYRETESALWRTLLHWNEEDENTSGPVGFTADGKGLYLIDARGSDTSRLVRLDIASGKIEELASDPEADVSNVILHPDTRELQMVSFEKARTEWRVVDEKIRAHVEKLKAMSDGDFFMINRDHADRRWIVGFVKDDGAVPYYVFDKETGGTTFLFDNYPQLKDYRLAKMEPVSFRSRDGLHIRAYATFPPGAERKNLPVVLNVHGGPWARDSWGWDAEAQWLANRGYVCMQVNYRGSTGYGKSFMKAANREWGGKMHDDLVDAVEWAKKEGWADPNRIAIYGGSYGGYAALVGATFTPDLFSCSVAIVGPSNLLTFIRSIPPYWSIYLKQFHAKVGNPDTEEAFLRERSPLFKVDRIKIPMLIAQGANDPRVKQAESEQIVAAMKEKGIDHEYLLFPDEGHGFAKPANRLKFYGACERFLAKHLGGRAET